MTDDTTEITKQEQLQTLLSKLPKHVLRDALAEKAVITDPSGEMTEIIRNVSQEYSGPLPLPSMLKQYEEIQSGFADRIITMAEKEQS